MQLSGRESRVSENERINSAAIIPIPGDDDALNRTGQTILDLIQRAATAAEKNSQHAMGIAHKLSLELRAAEDHIKKLQIDLQHYKARCDRAEGWLRQISSEIKKRFFPSDEIANPESARRAGPENYAPKKPDRRCP